jgi:hypothetical protein
MIPAKARIVIRTSAEVRRKSIVQGSDEIQGETPFPAVEEYS